MRKKTPKMSGLVVAALRNLRGPHGSTAKEIMKYIMAEYNASESTVQRQLKTALKRGVEYGILKKTNIGYRLNTDAEVIVPLGFQPMDSCKKKKRKKKSKKSKRKCGKRSKKKRKKRSSCGRKKKKKAGKCCNMCAVRRSKRNCNQPVDPIKDDISIMDDESNPDSSTVEKKSLDGDEQDESRDMMTRNGSTFKCQRHRSRSRSTVRNRYSGSENDEEIADDDL